MIPTGERVYTPVYAVHACQIKVYAPLFQSIVEGTCDKPK